jgi:hypothetical protein
MSQLRAVEGKVTESRERGETKTETERTERVRERQ